MAGVLLLMGEAASEAREGMLVGRARNSGASACPLVCVGGFCGLCQQVPVGPRSSVCTVVYRASPGPFCWARVAVGSESLKAASLLVDGVMCPPAQLVAWPEVSQYWCL